MIPLADPTHDWRGRLEISSLQQPRQTKHQNRNPHQDNNLNPKPKRRNSLTLNPSFSHLEFNLTRTHGIRRSREPESPETSKA